MPPKSAAAAPVWEWPFDEVRLRLADGTWEIRRRPADAVPTATNTDEETP